MGGRTVRRGRPARRLLIDLTPVRRCRDLRRLVLGELISVFGTQLTTVAVFRSTVIQLAVPDALRGRLSGLRIAVVTGGPRVGDLEAGAVAAGFGDTVSVISGAGVHRGGRCCWPACCPASAISGRRRRRLARRAALCPSMRRLISMITKAFRSYRAQNPS